MTRINKNYSSSYTDMFSVNSPFILQLQNICISVFVKSQSGDGGEGSGNEASIFVSVQSVLVHSRLLRFFGASDCSSQKRTNTFCD